MKDGLIQQIGTPTQVYDEPANAFVADFIGESNIFSGNMVKDFCVEFVGHQFECVDKGFKKNEPIDVIVRPEDIRIVEEGDDKALVKGVVQTCVFKGDHYQITAIIKVDDEENEMLIHDNVKVEEGQTIGLYIKPFDLHIMHKARLINTLEGVMYDKGIVEMCGGRFECQSDLEEGTRVKIKVDFDDVEICDDEEDGVIGATVVSSMYKGSYYQCIVRTDDYYDFFVDTDYDWLKDDRVGIKIAPDKIIVERIETDEQNG
jgi:spermidine/putrescine transport system ATP-binding protein